MRRKVPWPEIVSLGTALLLTRIPLFDVLGFEFSVAVAFVLTYVSGLVACGVRNGGEYPGQDWWRSLWRSLSLAIWPLVVIGFNGLRVPTCNWTEGLAFYGVIVIPGIFYGSCLGFLTGQAFGEKRGRMAFVLWSLITYAYALWHILRHPQIFAYNAYWAFFPGPVYDRHVPLAAGLVLSRAMLLLQATWFLLTTVLCWQKTFEWRALWRNWQGTRAALGCLWLLQAVSLLLLFAHQEKLGLRIGRDHVQQALGSHLATEHCDIYFSSASYTQLQASELAWEHEFHFAELQDFFQLTPEKRIGSYVYASAGQKKQLMGAAGTNFEDALNDEFHVNASSFPHPVLRHEMAHMFAAQIDRFRPVNFSMGLHEGIAVAAEWRRESQHYGLTPHESVVAMDSLGLRPDLRRILGAVGFWTQSSSRAYTTAGSFVRYLIDAHSIEAFKKLWSSGNWQEAYGDELDVLVRNWERTCLNPARLSAMQLRRAERAYRRRAIFSEPCAHEQARLRRQAAHAYQRRDWDQAEDHYLSLREIEPDQVAHEIRLARLALRRGHPELALKRAFGVLEHPEFFGSEHYDALRLVADSHWHLSEWSAADSAFARASRLAAFRHERRAAQVARWALADSTLRHGLRDYLTNADLTDAAALTHLALLRAKQASHPLPRYLLGRRLYFAGQFEACLEELSSILEAELPSDVRIACLEMCAQAALRSEQPERTLRFLDPLENIPLETAERLACQDLARRALWRVRTAKMP